ncbi:phosphoribosyltransferase [Ferrovibrio sp.]|uniref:phosphoribosyltransferase n=1 Tax=Ferrovibrio sp. TaxID=1917215 RepID=UPI002615CBF3|nr:phosphoribosyltransferase [Ferrovibrio sp.]
MFLDRTEAGRRLAQRLQDLQDTKPVILALPRGGVPVAAEVASALHAPLDLLLVRKIGAPHHGELAVAAVADGQKPRLVVNREVADSLHVDDDYLRTAAQRELAEIERRRKRYDIGQPHPEVKGRTVIVVDDGIATGATAKAALMLLRAAQPKSIILAIPVAASSTLEEFRGLADRIVCLETPPDFYAVGAHYREFPQLTDDQVVEFLKAAVQPTPPQ